mgnify:CR=1 FL=1
MFLARMMLISRWKSSGFCWCFFNLQLKELKIGKLARINDLEIVHTLTTSHFILPNDFNLFTERNYTEFLNYYIVLELFAWTVNKNIQSMSYSKYCLFGTHSTFIFWFSVELKIPERRTIHRVSFVRNWLQLCKFANLIMCRSVLESDEPKERFERKGTKATWPVDKDSTFEIARARIYK